LRARRIVVEVVQRPRRREFRQLAGLAASVWDAALEDRLDELARHPPAEVSAQIADLERRVANRLRSTHPIEGRQRPTA